MLWISDPVHVCSPSDADNVSRPGKLFQQAGDFFRDNAAGSGLECAQKREKGDHGG